MNDRTVQQKQVDIIAKICFFKRRKKWNSELYRFSQSFKQINAFHPSSSSLIILNPLGTTLWPSNTDPVVFDLQGWKEHYTSYMGSLSLRGYQQLNYARFEYDIQISALGWYWPFLNHLPFWYWWLCRSTVCLSHQVHLTILKYSPGPL